MRVTREEIDRGILDVAASVFAQHGYASTSVQQVADAVGYSKPGLLHRFGSKEALFRAGLNYGTELVDQILAEGSEIAFDKDRTRRLLELVTRNALKHPGLIAMMIRAFEFEDEGPVGDEIRMLGYKVLAMLNPPFETAEERLRLVLAMQLILNAATAQQKRVDFDLSVPADQLVPLVVGLSLQVMNSPVAAVRSVS